MTYSLGRLVLRRALAGDCGWRHHMPVAGLVQIGPPNRGARAAGIIRALLPGNRIAGPAARMLCDPPDKHRSTARRQTGIPVDVRSVLLGTLKSQRL